MSLILQPKLTVCLLFRPESTRSDSAADRSNPQRSTERSYEAGRDHAAVDAVTLHTDSIHYSDRQDTEITQGELSLPQSAAGECDMVSFVPYFQFS